MWLLLSALLVGSLNAYASSTKGYKGDVLPPDQLAIIVPDRQKTGVMAHQTVQIFQVDDVPVGGVLKGWPKQVEVPAGEHTITFRFFNSNEGSKITGGGAPGMLLGGGVIGGAKTVRTVQKMKEKMTLTVTVAAGRQYVLKFAPLFTPDRFWIEDKSDASVAGEYKPEGTTDLKSIIDKK